METGIVEWGVNPKSQVILQTDGECQNITHYNTLTPSPKDKDGNIYTESIGDHTFSIDFGFSDIPDTFSVVPAYGWEVVGDNFIVVAEGASALIRVCQMLIG